MSLILSGTDGLSDIDGSAATPAIRGTDANTGIFFGADIIGFSEGGAEVMRLDASGNLGIGTQSAVGRVESKTANMTGASAAYAQKAFVANIPYSTSNITSSLLAGFDGGSIHGVDVGYAYNGTGYNLMFATNSTTTGSPTERVRITSVGDFFIGKTQSGVGTTGWAFTNPTTSTGSNFVFAINNNEAFTYNNLNSGTTYFVDFRTQSAQRGYIGVSDSSVNYSTTSDYRLKNSIAPMTGALAKVALLKPCTYKWKADGSDGQGFVAHELADVVPACVTGEKDAVDADGNPKYQGIDTSFLVATLTAAIQEQQAIITQLQADVAALKA